MKMLRGIWHFFIPRERILVYTTFDQGQYARVKGRLAAAGVPHRSRINGGMKALNQRARYGGKATIQYDLYVSKEDEHRAIQAIQ
ncbi:hypothetical protein [Paenibacillus sp. MMS20-IR301]|uniref:hypothetical protein n=1 Tax=Paenibacillus sp. MMS20-IR301 TaxID=2895946 RepID=UPI0028E28AF5|nr:hypothetical protein [Paenibacillus sp. MMS20-IR301]WNS44372.1 hypothetical protein LOS79_03610 [Paenibacillus sp. MMS20-IR301]